MTEEGCGGVARWLDNFEGRIVVIVRESVGKWRLRWRVGAWLVLLEGSKIGEIEVEGQRER